MKYLRLLLCVFLCEAVGLAGSLFMANFEWYSALVKPSFFPPNWLFGPVWITLYALMGASLYLVWSSRGKSKERAFAVFGLQLFLNGVWSPLFFGYRLLALSLLDIVLLWIAIAFTVWVFWHYSKLASGLLMPYLVWVSIATLLNYTVFMLLQPVYL